MSSKNQSAQKRLREHAKTMRSFLEELDRLEGIVPDTAAEQFRMPYTSRPEVTMSRWKMTLDA